VNKSYHYHMNEFIPEEEFALLMKDRRAGNTTLIIPSIVARRFFTHIGRDAVLETTGKSITLKKTLILACAVLAPLLFLCFTVSIYLAYGSSYASFIIPVAGICWVIIFGLTSNHGGWAVGTVPLVLSGILLATTNTSYGLPLTLLILSIWLQRSTYLLSAFWLENIVAHSYAAYEILVEHIEITTITDD